MTMAIKRKRYILEKIMLNEERNGNNYSDRWFDAWKKYQEICDHDRHSQTVTASGQLICVHCGKTLATGR